MPQIMTNAFSAGEFSPRLLARTDLDKRKSGCRRLRDFFIQPQGGVYGRPGTRYVAEVKDSTKITRLIPFEFSTEQAYILEVGDTHFRFYKDDGRIESPPGTPVEVAHPYDETELFDLKYAQTADVLYLIHKNYAPRKLTRTSHTSWTLTTVAFKDGPYMPMNGDTTKTLTCSVTTLGASGTLTATGHSPFVSGHVGSLWEVSNGTVTGYVEVTGYTSATVVNMTVKEVVPTAAQWKWREGAFSAHRLYPRSVGFVEERLFLAATPSQPTTMWGSVNGDFENHKPGTNDDDAVEYQVASGKINPLHWLVEDRGMFIGTSKSELRMGGGSDTPLSPSSARVLAQTKYGSKSIQPVETGNETLFVQRGGRKVRALQYNFSSDSYNAPDRTLYAEHITESGIKDWCYQQEPDSIVYCVLNNGTLATMTYVPEEQVVGWSLHTTDGAFESVACIPGAETDRVWVVVRRVINGVTKRYVEYFDPLLHMDCAVSYAGSPVLSVSAPAHLLGKTAVIVGDGAVYNSVVVGGGSITLAPAVAASAIDIGLLYTPTLVPLSPEVPDRGGSLQGRKSRWVKLGVRLLNTLGVTINGDQVESRSSDDEMDQAPEMTTGDAISVTLGWTRNGENTITQTQPLPITVLGVFGTLDSEG